MLSTLPAGLRTEPQMICRTLGYMRVNFFEINILSNFLDFGVEVLKTWNKHPQYFPNHKMDIENLIEDSLKTSNELQLAQIKSIREVFGAQKHLEKSRNSTTN